MKRRLPTPPLGFMGPWHKLAVNAVICVVAAVVLHQGRFATIISLGWTVIAIAFIGVATYKFFHDPAE